VIRKLFRLTILMVVSCVFVIGGFIPTSQAEKKTSLRIAHSWDSGRIELQQKFDEMFMKKYPDIVIKFENTSWGDFNQKYLVQAAAGTLPDLIYCHCSWAPKWISSGAFLDLTPFLEGDKEFDIGDFFPVSLEAFRHGGNLYGISYDTGTNELCYNVDMFDKAGLAYPDETWTLEEQFLDTAKKLTKDTDGDGKVDQWGWLGVPRSSLIDNYIRPFGGRFLNEDETECLLTMPEAIKGVQWWANLILKYKVEPSASEQAALLKPFYAGKIGMSWCAPWSFPGMNKYCGFKWDVALFPKGPVKKASTGGGSGYAITKNCEFPEVAWAYLREYLSKEGMASLWGRTGMGSPSRESVWADFESSPGAPKNVHIFFIALRDYAVSYPCKALGLSEAHTILNREMELVELGKKTAEEACKIVKKEVDPILW